MKELENLLRSRRRRELPITWGGNAIVRPDMTPALPGEDARGGQPDARLRDRIGFLARAANDAQVRPAGDERPRPARHDGRWDRADGPVDGRVPHGDGRNLFGSLSISSRPAPGSIGVLAVSLFSIGQMHALKEQYGLAPDADDPYWRTRDGKNTFPVRLDRLRRLMEAANESGVGACYHAPLQGAIRLPELADYEARALRLYDAR